MTAVLFTKLFGDRPLAEIAATIAELGFDGVDLLVRPGFSLTPDDPTRIRPAVELCREHGLAVPMATTDLTDPAAYPARAVLAACAEAGIRLVRLGYWKYDAQRGYGEILEAARRDLDALQTLAAGTGVTLAVQVHGGTIHASGALAGRLLEGFDPALIAAYADPGNQAVQDGREDWRLTLDILRPRLRCLGVKNGGWFPAAVGETGQRCWRSDWLGLAEGMVPWDEILAHLAATGWEGVLSLHSHYELPYEQVLDQTRADIRYVHRLLAGR